MEQASTKSVSLENVIQNTLDLSYRFDKLAFGEKPESGDKNPMQIGQVDRLIDRLQAANSKLSNALGELSKLGLNP